MAYENDKQTSSMASRQLAKQQRPRPTMAVLAELRYVIVVAYIISYILSTYAELCAVNILTKT
jgi:hypothetical protein